MELDDSERGMDLLDFMDNMLQSPKASSQRNSPRTRFRSNDDKGDESDNTQPLPGVDALYSQDVEYFGEEPSEDEIPFTQEQDTFETRRNGKEEKEESPESEDEVESFIQRLMEEQPEKKRSDEPLTRKSPSYLYIPKSTNPNRVSPGAMNNSFEYYPPDIPKKRKIDSPQRSLSLRDQLLNIRKVSVMDQTKVSKKKNNTTTVVQTFSSKKLLDESDAELVHTLEVLHSSEDRLRVVRGDQMERIEVGEMEEENKEKKRKLPEWVDKDYELRQKEIEAERVAKYRQWKESLRASGDPNAKLPVQVEMLQEFPATGRIICFDLETTGFGSDDNIIEIGAVELIDGCRTGALFQSYCQPLKAVHPMAQEAHGLSDSFLQSQPSLRTILTSFLRWIGTSPLVAHNASFDIRMLFQSLALCRISQPSLQVLCSLQYFRRMFPGLPYSLDSAAAYFKVSSEFHRKKHGALVDSEILARIVQEMRKRIKEKQKPQEKDK